ETVRIWEVNTGKELQKLEGGTGDFLPDGKRFATASSEDDTISIWDVNTGKKLATLEGTREVLISPDGRKIVTQSEQGAIRVWDTDSGRKLFELEDFPYCFSSDGKILIVNDDGSEIAGVRIVDAESGRRLRRLEGEFGALSHDGQRIALVSGNGVWVWRWDEAGDQPEVRPAQAEKVEVTIDNVKREITSVRLRDNETIVLNVGDLCHYIEDEKLSIPFRWAYSISDENVVSVFHDQYEYDESRSRPLPGADEGWRTVCFQAISPGECVITVRYKDIVDAYYHAERIYTVKVRIDDNLNDKPIDPQPPQPPTNNGATARAENTGATISIDKTTYEPGDKIVVRYSGFTKNVFHSGNYPVIQIYDDKMPAVCDSEMFLDFISQGKDNVPSSGTVELQLPNYPGTFEVRLRFYSQELDRIVNATIPVTVKPKNDPTPQPHPAPTPQPPGGNVGAKLVGTWNAPYSSATYNPLLGGVRMVFGGVIYRFNDDGTFEYRVFTGNSQSQFTGKYTASEGKNSITLERSSQKNVMEYEYGTDNEGEYLRIGFLHEDSNDLKMFRRSKQAPEQPPNVMIDSEIIGAWSCQEYGADNTLYVYQFNADGTFFIEVRRWHWSDEKGGKTNRIDGKFTTSGGTVYLTDQVLTYDPGDNKKTEPLKNKSSAYKFGTTEILNTKYVEISVFNASNTIPDPEGLRNFYAVAELPTPQPPDRNIDAALVGVWRHTTYDVIARSTDIYLWFLNKDGTFKLALVTSRKDYFHEGNYSVSDGKIYLSNVVFTNDDYVGNKPDSQVRFVAGRDSEGKEQLEISRVLDGFAPNGTWFRINTTEDNDGGST
ncbi:MAG: hypothetical protein FWD31_06955, partial [Planctomycetaceae bacterium]|nr:hypothetical protein [Planctomycetaceae bacterium]